MANTIQRLQAVRSLLQKESRRAYKQSSKYRKESSSSPVAAEILFSAMREGANADIAAALIDAAIGFYINSPVSASRLETAYELAKTRKPEVTRG